MRYLINILLSAVALFFLNACSDDSADEFSSQMLAGQIIYTFNEKDGEWVRTTFDVNGNLLYEFLKGSELGGSYSIQDGKIVVNDNDKNPTISLYSKEATLWRVSGLDDDLKVWADTWYLEQKFASTMIVGKNFSSSFVVNGSTITEKLEFTETTFKITASDSSVRNLPYKLVNGTIIVDDDRGGLYTLNLMLIDANGNYNLWYSSTRSESGHSVWLSTN